MINPEAVQEFLGQHRIAVIGASDDPKSFGNTIFQAMKDHGYDAVPVHPTVPEVDGVTCYPDLASIPGDVDGAIVMVNQAAAPGIVDECAAKGIDRVWLFKGLGSPGALSAEAVERCAHHGITVVEGACPLMFLQPVGGFHRFHRALRRMNGSLAKAS
ncbi:MAG TPA: CoA-binding protein [Acidimicrobiales bacterium]